MNDRHKPDLAHDELPSQIEAALWKENERRLSAEKVIRKQSQALTETTDLLLRQPALPDFFQATLRTITHEFGGMWAALWLMEDDSSDPKRKASYCINPSIRKKLEAFRITNAHCITQFSAHSVPMLAGHRGPIVLKSTDERISTENQTFFKETGVEAIVISPLWLGNRLLGWISFFAAVPIIDSDKLAFVFAISQQVALALHVSHLRKAEHEVVRSKELALLADEREKELSLISDVLQSTAQALDDGLSLPAVLEAILKNLGSLFGNTQASVWTPVNLESTPVPLVALRGKKYDLFEDDTRSETAKHLPSQTKHLIKSWLQAPDYTVEEAKTPSIQRCLQMTIGGDIPVTNYWLIIPMYSSSEPSGILLVASEKAIESTCDRLLAAKALAQQAALAIRMDALSSANQRASLLRERSRIGRDLHDLLAQSLSGIVLQIEAMKAECHSMPDEIHDRLEKISHHAKRSVEEVRRTLHMLRPVLLTEHSLAEALSALTTETSSMYGLDTQFICKSKSLQIPRAIEPHLFAITSEALNNVVKHSNAKNVTVTLSEKLNSVILMISDNGNGMHPVSRKTQKDDHFGLITMRDRAQQIGAKFVIKSNAAGTSIRITCPL